MKSFFSSWLNIMKAPLVWVILFYILVQHLWLLAWQEERRKTEYKSPFLRVEEKLGLMNVFSTVFLNGPDVTVSPFEVTVCIRIYIHTLWRRYIYIFHSEKTHSVWLGLLVQVAQNVWQLFWYGVSYWNSLNSMCKTLCVDVMNILLDLQRDPGYCWCRINICSLFRSYFCPSLLSLWEGILCACEYPWKYI